MTWLDVINWMQGTGLRIAFGFAVGAAVTAAYYRPKVRELSAEFKRDEERLDTQEEHLQDQSAPSRRTDPNPEPRG